MPASPNQLEFAAVSHAGKVREDNQDRVLGLPEHGIFLLADGIGGNRGGGIASQMAMDSISASLLSGKTVVEAILMADREIFAAARSGENVENMGTTIVALTIKDQQFDIAWLGDSRAYRVGHQIEQLTRDHSLVQGLQDEGLISPEQARTHPKRNIITRVLGLGTLTDARIDTVHGQLHPGELILLSTDGLHGSVDNAEIHNTISNGSGLDSMANELLGFALDRGGRDNISLVLVKASDHAA